MKKTLKVDVLSQSSLKQLKKDLQTYKNSVETKTKTLCQRLADSGVQIAKAYVYSIDAVFTGELFGSIHSVEKASTENRFIFAVVADNAHAVFVEFGTGIVGKESPYPYELPSDISWQYASGRTIRQLSDGRYGWFYQRDGQWYFTEGMPSRPFMYSTSIELQGKIVKIAKEVFK